jgi:FkbM family methyltransferase
MGVAKRIMCDPAHPRSNRAAASPQPGTGNTADACRTLGETLARPGGKDLARRLFWLPKYGIVQRVGDSRADVQLVASLCDPNRVSLDIGADVGEFTIATLRSSRSVIAFEPRPAQARDLTSTFGAVGAAVRVEAVALSDKPGVMTMRVVESDPGRSTTDANNVLGDADDGGVQSIDVPVKRLAD